jgi:hypothetical protein
MQHKRLWVAVLLVVSGTLFLKSPPARVVLYKAGYEASSTTVLSTDVSGNIRGTGAAILTSASQDWPGHAFGTSAPHPGPCTPRDPVAPAKKRLALFGSSCSALLQRRNSTSLLGLEVGAMHNPARLPPFVTMRYVDALPVAELRLMHPELAAFTLVEPDILDTAGGVIVLEDKDSPRPAPPEVTYP